MSKKSTIRSIFIIAGEESGDIHGAHLVGEIKRLNPSTHFSGIGGDRMKAAGVEIIEHISNLSLVGFTEVVKHLPYIHRVMKNTVNEIKNDQPSRIILIDYPGFNLSIAKRIQKLNIPITYFILPQVWAWKESRAYKLKDLADQLLSIIPFEKEWFEKRGIDIDFVGHPFVDIEQPQINKSGFFLKHSLDESSPLLTLLPGSRQQEIDRHWPIFITVINNLHEVFPKLQFIIGKAPGVVLSDYPNFVRIEKDSPRLTMHYADAGLIASGTATLEAAVTGLPAVVCYKTSTVTYLMGKFLAKVKYLSLINLIENRSIVPEFIQQKMTTDALVKAITPLLSKTPERDKMIEGYNHAIKKLGDSGVYSRSAKLILDKIIQ